MSTATDMLAKYLAAEQGILEGKEVTLGETKLRMEDLEQVRAGRKEWERRAAAEQSQVAGVPRIGGLTFSRADFSGRGGR